jgi:hypothetical protein
MKRSALRLVVTLWDTPLSEQVPFIHYWKHVDGKTGTNFAQQIPRSVNGCLEAIQPRTQENIKWFPYRDEYYVNNKSVPSFRDVLHTHYFPPMPTDDERIAYIAEKTGRKPIDVAAEMFKMRRLRLGIAQSLRDKIKGKWFRSPLATWSTIEKNYLDSTLKVAQAFGADFYSNQNFDPYLVYSPTYNFAETVDMVFNKQFRTKQQYLLIEVVVHNTVPRSRLPNVKGTVREPISHLEPCLHAAIKLKLEVMAQILKEENYVTDHPYDTGHAYQGCIVHLHKGYEHGEVLFNLEPTELDKDMGRTWLAHYKEHHVDPIGNSYEVARDKNY